MSGMTNISMGQIFEMLKDWDLIILELKIYNSEIASEVAKLGSMMRFILKLKLNAAKDGWQGDHYFETHIKEDVRHKQETSVERVGRWFGKNKKRVIEEREM